MVQIHQLLRSRRPGGGGREEALGGSLGLVAEVSTFMTVPLLALIEQNWQRGEGHGCGSYAVVVAVW